MIKALLRLFRQPKAVPQRRGVIAKLFQDCHDGRHAYSPWVQERWIPTVDTRVCRLCRHVSFRQHEEGTEMFPQWLVEEMGRRNRA